jgi:hypothetical protein
VLQVRRSKKDFKWGDLTQTYLLALFFVTLLLAGTVLDLANIQKYPMIALEELFELFSAQARGIPESA